MLLRSIPALLVGLSLAAGALAAEPTSPPAPPAVPAAPQAPSTPAKPPPPKISFRPSETISEDTAVPFPADI